MYDCVGTETSWPTLNTLREKSDETLKHLTVSKVEWTLDRTRTFIASLRFTLNDGTTSNQIGVWEVD